MAWLAGKLPHAEWLRSLDAIHVAGTDGKGSTSTMCASILGSLGVECGLYTSPHLYDFRERIVLEGSPIPDAELAEGVAWFDQQLRTWAEHNRNDQFGAFEAFTALALHYFSNRGAATVVAEAGIGGRYDSTRVIPGDVCVLTSVGSDHQELLGDTAEKIACDKADLCPDGGVLVCSRLEEDVARRLSAYAQIRGIELLQLGEHFEVEEVRAAGRSMRFSLRLDGEVLENLSLPILGLHQVRNCACAVVAVRAWLRRNRPTIAPEEFDRAVREGLHRARLPGRFELIAARPDTYIDIGHTPEAAASLCRAVRDALGDTPVLLVTGVSFDKKVEEVVTTLAGIASEVVCTRAHHKGAPVERVRAAAVAAGGSVVACEPVIEKAMALAAEMARRKGQVIVVAGGLFLAIEAATAIGGHDPRQLRFF